MARWQGKPGIPQRWKNKLTLPRPGEERRAVVSGILAKKVSKEQVKYRQSMNEAENKQSCSECQNFEQPGQTQGSCVRVAGVISGDDVCDLFVVRLGPGVGATAQEVGSYE